MSKSKYVSLIGARNGNVQLIGVVTSPGVALQVKTTLEKEFDIVSVFDGRRSASEFMIKGLFIVKKSFVEKRIKDANSEKPKTNVLIQA
jgi:hypothetical protein